MNQFLPYNTNRNAGAIANMMNNDRIEQIHQWNGAGNLKITHLSPPARSTSSAAGTSTRGRRTSTRSWGRTFSPTGTAWRMRRPAWSGSGPPRRSPAGRPAGTCARRGSSCTISSSTPPVTSSPATRSSSGRNYSLAASFVIATRDRAHGQDRGRVAAAHDPRLRLEQRWGLLARGPAGGQRGLAGR